MTRSGPESKTRSVMPRMADFLRTGLKGHLAFWGVELAVLGAVASLGLAGCGPIGPIPGGKLSGMAGPPKVANWGFADHVKHAQLETRPDDPLSVNTWFVGMGPTLYVPTSMTLGSKEPAERNWVKEIDADDRVRIRVGSMIYERRATRVADGSAEYEQARTALEARYEISPEDRDPERTIWIFRLDAR